MPREEMSENGLAYDHCVMNGSRVVVSGWHLLRGTDLWGRRSVTMESAGHKRCVSRREYCVRAEAPEAMQEEKIQGIGLLRCGTVTAPHERMRRDLVK